MEQEYDVTRSSWDIYRCMYKDHLHICPDSIIKKGTQRAYIKSSFMFNGKKSEELAFSGETDFNFSRTKIFGYGRSRYEHFKKSYENLNALKSFLELFQNIHEYCKVIYCIDSKLTDDLVDSGRKPIDSAKRAIEYMELAHAFWRQKETILVTPERSQPIN